MKRLNGLFERIISLTNLRLAAKKARQGKSYYAIKKFDRNADYHLRRLHDDKTKVIVKFSYEETDSDFHTFITSSEVIADRLSKDRDKLPFIAAVKRRKKYTYYE